MEQCQEIGDNAFDGIGHKHLVAVELNLVLLKLYTILDFREIEDTGQVKRIIHIQMNMEQRFVGHGVEGPVELVVVLFLHVGWLAGPCGLGVVNLVVLVGLFVFVLLPFLLLAKDDGDGKELAVLVQ